MNVFIGFIEYAAWMAGVYGLNSDAVKRAFYDAWLWADRGHREAMSG